MQTITVPTVEGYQDKIGQLVNLPVRAWASGQPVNFAYEPAQGVQRDRGPGRANGTVRGRAAPPELDT